MNSTIGQGINSKVFRFSLDAASGIPFYRQIIQQVEHNMSTGVLVPGYRLPTIRSLAIELKINPNTIAKAYNELEIRGLVTTQVGAGTFISDKTVILSEIEINEKVEKAIASFIRTLRSYGLTIDEIRKRVNNYEGD